MTTLFGRKLPIVAGVLIAVAIVADMVSPPDRIQGDLVRLMYVHVPSAWIAFLAFGITFAASGLWLWRRQPRFDRLASASAEVGVFFTGLAIVLGSVWGKPVWGVWWAWDPRLVTTALMFFVYLGYLALRRATVDPLARARRSAVFGVAAFVQVPIVHLSVLWWRSLHQPPTVLRPGDPTIDDRMLAALLLSLAAFTVIFVVLLRARVRLAAAEESIEAIHAAEDRELAGAAVVAPRLEGTGIDV
jgi:heme exporter protein C